MQRLPLIALRRAWRAAKRLAANRSVTSALLAAARLVGRHGLAPVRNDLATVLRLTREAAAGRYRRVPKRALVALIAGIVYLVNPLDLVPDVLPLVGFADDLAVLLWVTRQFRHELDEFLAWEREWGGALDVEACPVAEPRLRSSV